MSFKLNINSNLLVSYRYENEVGGVENERVGVTWRASVRSGEARALVQRLVRSMTDIDVGAKSAALTRPVRGCNERITTEN